MGALSGRCQLRPAGTQETSCCSQPELTESTGRARASSGSRSVVEKKLRCAVYTRKSTDDGLDQEFNSLDAQYEACAACGQPTPRRVGAVARALRRRWVLGRQHG